MKCPQCGFEKDVPPNGTGRVLCPNCGGVLREASSAPAEPSPTDTATNTHLKIAKTVNVGFGDFASTLAAANASRIITPAANASDQTSAAPSATHSGSTLNIAAPDDDDDLPTMDVYDEDDEYARIQAEIAARQAALDQRTAELDAREEHLNRKLDEIISEKEFLRTGIEKTDEERASYLKQKSMFDAKKADLEKEMAARKAALDARAAEIEKKSEALNKMRSELEKLKREMDASMTGEQPIDDATTSSVSIPYSAKLLRRSNKLERTVRIQTLIVICLTILYLILIALYCDLLRKTERQKTELNRMIQQLTSEQTEAAASAESVSPETSNQSAPESQTSGGGL
jgi:transcription initiation factor TFIIIB Brf1 subunit/transcription initiation factor TFIIB